MRPAGALRCYPVESILQSSQPDPPRRVNMVRMPLRPTVILPVRPAPAWLLARKSPRRALRSAGGHGICPVQGLAEILATDIQTTLLPPAHWFTSVPPACPNNCDSFSRKEETQIPALCLRRRAMMVTMASRLLSPSFSGLELLSPYVLAANFS